MDIPEFPITDLSGVDAKPKLQLLPHKHTESQAGESAVCCREE